MSNVCDLKIMILTVQKKQDKHKSELPGLKTGHRDKVKAAFKTVKDISVKNFAHVYYMFTIYKRHSKVLYIK